MTTPNSSGFRNLVQQLFAPNQSVATRGSLMARLLGRGAGAAMGGGPAGIGLFAASMFLPFLMGGAQQGGGGGGNERTGTAMDRLSDQLDEVTRGFHRLNVDVMQLSRSVGQTSSDTLKMGAAFAAIGKGDATGAGMELANQLGLQTGQWRLGQMGQGAMMGSGLLGLNMGQMMDQTPSEQLSYIVDELRKLNRTELESVETLAALEMLVPGLGRDLIAMAGAPSSAITAQRQYERAIEQFMTGPRGRALEEQSRGLLVIAQRIAMRADLYSREQEYLRSPFAEEQAGRGEQRAEWKMQFGRGFMEGMQGALVIFESWADSFHRVIQGLFGEGSQDAMRSFGQYVGKSISDLLSLVQAIATFAGWVVNAARLIFEIVMIPMRIGQNPFRGVQQAWASLNFESGTITGDMMNAYDDSLRAAGSGDARRATGRMSAGMRPGYPAVTGQSGMGRAMEGGVRVEVEVSGKDDFANMLQYGMRQNTNLGKRTPGAAPGATTTISPGG